MRYYTLNDDNIPVPSTFEGTMELWSNGEKRRVAKTVVGNATVSTVFLVINHSYNENSLPVLWETLVFGGQYDGDGERYTSYEDAVIGHSNWVKKLFEIN